MSAEDLTERRVEVLPAIAINPEDIEVVHEMRQPDRSTTLKEKIDEIKKLDRRQFDYVIARAKEKSPTVALATASIPPTWWKSLDEGRRELLENLADELHYEMGLQALYELHAATLRAAQEKIKGLDSQNERVRQKVASEILDRVVGRPDNNMTVHANIVLGWDIPWQKK